VTELEIALIVAAFAVVAAIPIALLRWQRRADKRLYAQAAEDAGMYRDVAARLGLTYVEPEHGYAENWLQRGITPGGIAYGRYRGYHVRITRVLRVRGGDYDPPVERHTEVAVAPPEGNPSSSWPELGFIHPYRLSRRIAERMPEPLVNALNQALRSGGVTVRANGLRGKADISPKLSIVEQSDHLVELTDKLIAVADHLTAMPIDDPSFTIARRKWPAWLSSLSTPVAIVVVLAVPITMTIAILREPHGWIMLGILSAVTALGLWWPSNDS
jgi:hypothetical protein